VSRSILFYGTADGKCPVQDFFAALPGKVAQKVFGVQEIELAENCRRDYWSWKGIKK
jgi:hypothetical protein